MTWTVRLNQQAFSTWNTLCDRHIAARRAEADSRGLQRWLSIDQLAHVDIGCADCSGERQAAPGYVTPTVDYVPTGSESRL